MQIKMVLLMLLFAGKINAQSKITVVTEGIENPAGQLMVALFDEANFLKMPLAARATGIEGDTAVVEFDSIVPGNYAISVFQDENGNGDLDRGAFGIPAEPYGFSNSAGKQAMNPTFGKYKFEVKEEDVTVNIILQRVRMR